MSVRTVIVCETSAKFLLISYSSSFSIQIKDIYSVFGDSFWPRQVGRTATKLSYPLHCQSAPFCMLLFFKSPHYVPPGIRWEDPNGAGNGQQLYFLPVLTHFVSRKKIYLLLNQLKFEKSDNVFIKSIHSGLWQNFLLLLAQMVVEQEADKLFS